MNNPHRKQTALSIFKDELRNKNKGYHSDDELTKKFYALSGEKKEEYRFRAKRFNMYLDSESNRYDDHFNQTPSITTMNDFCGESTLTTRSQFRNAETVQDYCDFEFSQVSTNYPKNQRVEMTENEQNTENTQNAENTQNSKNTQNTKNTQNPKTTQNDRITKNQNYKPNSNKNSKNQETSSSDSDDWGSQTTHTPAQNDVSDTDLNLGDDAESFVTYASSTITTVQPTVNLEELGYCKDAFNNPVTTKFYNAEKETKIDKTQNKFLIKVLDRIKQAGEDVYDIKWPILAFEWFYFIPDESPFCLPAEVSLQMFSLNEGFQTKKHEKCEKIPQNTSNSNFSSELPYYHEFISSSGHPTNCFGLKAEILNHTCQTNKISLWNDSSTDYAKIYRTILKTALEISKTLTKCDMKLSNNSSGGDYILFTDNVTATKESLSFLAEKADMSTHFEKHVKKGIFNFTKFVTVHYHFHGRLDLFNKMAVFEHPRNSLFSNIRCNFHNVDQEAEHSKTCARGTVRKMGYTWWQCMNNLHDKYDLKKELKGVGYTHFPGDKPEVEGVKAIEEEVEIDFENFAENLTLDNDTESEIFEKASLIGTASTFSVTSSFRGLRRRKLAKT